MLRKGAQKWPGERLDLRIRTIRVSEREQGQGAEGAKYIVADEGEHTETRCFLHSKNTPVRAQNFFLDTLLLFVVLRVQCSVFAGSYPY